MLLYDTVPPFVGRSEIREFPEGRRDGIWLCLDKLSLLQHYIIRNPKSWLQLHCWQIQHIRCNIKV